MHIYMYMCGGGVYIPKNRWVVEVLLRLSVDIHSADDLIRDLWEAADKVS